MNNYNYNNNFYNNSNSNNYMLFGAYEGYLKGNLFKNLYEEYKNYKPATLRPNSEKEQDLFNLNQLAFAMHDLNLYLDVYPNDKNILNMFIEYKEMYNSILNEFEKKYGPININGVDESIPFSWENTKFPWEVK